MSEALIDNVYWQAYMVFQYIAMFGVIVYWLYKKRVQRGYKVTFVSVPQQEGKGSYDIDEEAYNAVAKDMVVGVGKDNKAIVQRAVELVKGGLPEKPVVFLSDKEVKAGQDFISFQDKAFVIPWGEIAWREFGWEHMVIDITYFRSLRFGGEATHYYSPVDAGTVLGGKLFSKAFNEPQVGDYRLLFILGVMFAVVITAVVTYVVTMKLSEVPVESVAKFIGGVLFGRV